VPVLRDGRSEAGAFASAMAALWVRGGAVDWAAPLTATGARRLRLPTYAFQRRRYWLEGSPAPKPSERSPVDGWRYRLHWKPITAPSAQTLSGAWLVVLPAELAEDRWPTTLIGFLQQRGAQVLSLRYDGAVDTRAQLAGRLWEAVRESSGDGRVQGVVSLLALQEQRDSVHRSVPDGLAGTLALAQALGDADVRAPLWIVTRDAALVEPSDAVSSPVQAQVWGLAAAAAPELPERWGGIVDLPESLDEDMGPLVAGIVAGGHGEDQLAVRGRTAFVRRLARASADRAEGSWTPPSGTILITGGTGGLGAHVARWLARRGAEHLLLVSRRGAGAPGAAELQVELEGAGAEVTIAACDVADREQLAALIESLPEQRPLGAVVHAAGVSVTGTLDSMAASDLEQALSAKAQGAANLDSLTADLDLAAFVLFSSVSATFGSGQAPYAAANAYLDALAAQRRARGLVSTSVAWGAWAGEGMAAQEGLGEIMRWHGLDYMAPELALQALEEVLLREETLVAVVNIDWEAYAAAFASARSLPLIEDLPEVQGALAYTAAVDAQASSRELHERLRDASAEEERRQLLLELVQAEVAAVMGHSARETVDPRRAFKELGFDSLMAVELRKRLTSATGLALPAALAFNHPTTTALVDYLLERLAEHALAAQAPAHRELEQLEAALAGSSMDDDARSVVQTRLQALIAQLNDARRSQKDTTVAEEIESASADEVIDFIDKQLGLAGVLEEGV
jgi:NAD(P)-dependent dehydrogenase (short-subunit alcohol dehydrogenase family)/acyl carrier protein